MNFSITSFLITSLLSLTTNANWSFAIVVDADNFAYECFNRNFKGKVVIAYNSTTTEHQVFCASPNQYGQVRRTTSYGSLTPQLRRRVDNVILGR